MRFFSFILFFLVRRLFHLLGDDFIENYDCFFNYKEALDGVTVVEFFSTLRFVRS